MRIYLYLLVFACLPLLAADPVFDVPALLAPPLNAKVLSSTEKDGIVTEEVTFHSEMDGEKNVEIFAFFCYPKGAKGLPAFVWNQAGLGRADTYFPLLGAKRGYAALCIDYPLPKYRSTGNYPTDMALEGDPKASGIYHCAVALLRAVSYLQSRPEVNPERIGMAGSSWGGFFTTLMAGLDPRLKAASCMFGCGTLELGNYWWDGPWLMHKPMKTDRAQWAATLDPARRLPQSTVPIAWFSGTNDLYFWMPSLMQSYTRAGGPKHLSLMPNWDHGLPPQLDDQVFGWLDAHLQGKPPFITVSPLRFILTRSGRDGWAHWTFTPVPGRPIKSAELAYSFGEAGNWHARYWKALPASVKNTECSVKLPTTAVPYYIVGTVIDDQGYRYSTPLRRVDPPTHLSDLPTILDYNGAEWGDFEESSLVIARAFAMRIPPLVADAHDGAQAAKMAVGRHALPPVYFTAGVPHRLTCYLKSTAPATVTCKLSGRFDGATLTLEKPLPVGTEWASISLDYTPPSALSGSLSVEFTVPKDAEVMLDTLSFRPITK